MRRKIPHHIWKQIKTGYATGVEFRKIVRNTNIPKGTVFAYAHLGPLHFRISISDFGFSALRFLIALPLIPPLRNEGAVQN
jgi:hypothetical protein